MAKISTYKNVADITSKLKMLATDSDDQTVNVPQDVLLKYFEREFLIGKLDLNPKGQFVPDSQYNYLDVVENDGSSYISLIPLNEEPLENNQAWMLSAKKGDQGKPFVYEDFTPEQLENLRFRFIDFTPEQLLEIKGDKGDTFTFNDLTTEQKQELKGDVIAYNSLDELDKNDLASRVPIVGIIEEGNIQAVSGGEVFDKTMVKQVYLDSEVIRGKNLFDKTKVVTGRGISGDVGNIVLGTENPGYVNGKVSDYIYVEKGTYIMSGDVGATHAVMFSLFENKGDRVNPIAFIRGSRVVEFPEDGYVVIDLGARDYELMQFEKGGVATDYEEYEEPIVNEKIKEKYLPVDGKVEEGDTRAVSGGEVYDKTMLTSEIMDVIVEEGKNLFDKDACMEGVSISHTTGALIVNSGGVVSNYIKVVGEENYVISGWFGHNDLKLISLFENIGDTFPIENLSRTGDNITPSSDGYIVFIVNASPGDRRDTIQFEKGDTPTNYEPYTPPTYSKKIKNEYIDLPEIVDEIDISRVDSRYLSNRLKIEDAINMPNFHFFFKSISNIRNGGVSRSTIIESDEELEDVLIPINVHFGSNLGDDHSHHIWMDKECNIDMSDLRFFSPYYGELEVLKQSVTNSEMIFDNSLYVFSASLSDGAILAYNRANQGIFMSSDGDNYVQIKPEGAIVGITPNDNLLYEINGGLYLSTRDSNYTDEVLKLVNNYEGGDWGYQHWAVDNFGNCFTAPYQEENDVKIYKSSDNGVTWNLKYELIGHTQHVHSFIVDKTNNDIFVNCDGNGETMMTLRSVDNGETFYPIEIPWNSDYGICYANSEDKVYLTSGESGIKSMPSLSLTRDLENWEILIDSTANAGVVKELSGVLYFFQRAGQSNQYVKVLVSQDKGITWQEYMSTGHFVSSDMGATYGRGSWLNLVDEYGEEYFIMGSNIQYVNQLPPARVVSGGEHVQAFYYVKLPKLHVGNNVIEVKSGYLTDVINSDFPNEKKEDINLIHHFELNEQSGYVFDSVTSEKHILKGDFLWLDRGRRHNGWIYPFRSKISTSSLKIDRDNPIVINKEVPINDVTFCFWMKIGNARVSENGKFRHVLGREDDSFSIYTERENRFVLRYKEQLVTVRNVFKQDMERVFYMITITLKDGIVKIYSNGSLMGEGVYVEEPNLSESNFVVMANVGLNNTKDEDFLTDLRIYNRSLTAHEIIRIYENDNVIFYNKTP